MWLTRFRYALLLAALIAATPAFAEPVCRALLPDGRIVMTRPLLGERGLFCPSVVDRRFERIPRPTVGVTTGEIGPFTTGEIGPFTTGEIGPFTTGHIGPLTTFSNSAPSMAAHR